MFGSSINGCIFVPTKRDNNLKNYKMTNSNQMFAIQDTRGNFWIKNHNLGGFMIPKFGNDHTIKIWNDASSAQATCDDLNSNSPAKVIVTQIIQKK
jgi:hypothetical protein